MSGPLEQKTPEELKWPSVEVAYDFVIPSYGWLVSRFEAADTRLTTLLTLGATIALGTPILGKAIRPAIDFGSAWFVVGLGFFMVSVVIGLVARVRGIITLPNPWIIYRESLHETEWVFRKNALYFAGQHFNANTRAIQAKGSAAIAAAAAIIVEVLLFVLWIARA